MAINFYLDGRTDKSGDSPIRVSISLCGARFVSSTGVKIKPDKWNQKKQRVKQGASNARGVTYNVINNLLAKIETHFVEYENNCIRDSIKPTADGIKTEFNTAFKHRESKPLNAKKTIAELMDYFIHAAAAESSWAINMRKKFITLKNHIAEFSPSATADDINENWLARFTNHLRDDEKHRNTTILKAVKYLKWFMKWTYEKKLHNNTTFQNFSVKLKTIRHKVIFLEWDELMRVYDYEIPQNGEVVKLKRFSGEEYEKTVHDSAALKKTRDIFCFCCFSSLRYSDALNLKWSDVDGDVFTIATIKTNDTITINLNDRSRAILDRVRATNGSSAYVFPRMSNQKMNQYLKDLCELCEINQPVTQTYYQGANRVDDIRPKHEFITTHTGRRTFICNALMLGIPAEIVMKWTGHSDYKSMKPYIDVTNVAKARAMDKFNK